MVLRSHFPHRLRPSNFVITSALAQFWLILDLARWTRRCCSTFASIAQWLYLSSRCGVSFRVTEQTTTMLGDVRMHTLFRWYTFGTLCNRIGRYRPVNWERILRRKKHCTVRFRKAFKQLMKL